jgi:NAD(P)-dependent dehydrogenase (short-subunit alcohol dehydrogenase family)
MGKAITLLFVNNGCKVIAADINQDRLNTLDAEVKKLGGIITTIKANMANDVDVDAIINLAKTTYGTLNILVNNAGVMDNFQPVGEVDNETWDRVMKVNVDGPYKAMRGAIKIFMENGSGNIINIASIGGLKGGVAGAAYTTSKHALIGLTKNTGHMYAKSGIRCNAIAPGAVATSIGETIDMTKITPMVQDRIMTGMALNPRIGEPNEIATAALFLASDDASFINGAVLVVDGGWSSY